MMLVAENLEIDFTSKNDGTFSIFCSPSPSDEERELSNYLKKYVHEKHGDRLRKKGFMTVNFDVKRTRSAFLVKGVYLVKQDSDVIYFPAPTTYKIRTYDNIMSSILKRVGDFMLSRYNYRSPFESSIMRTYLISAIAFGLLAMAGFVSLLNGHFIPSPIDKMMAWTCSAGAFGFFIDNLKRKKT